MKILSLLPSLLLLQEPASAFTAPFPLKPTRTTTTNFKMSKNQQNNNGEPKVVVVGSANQDLTSYTGVVPVLGQTVMGQTFDTSCGGKGANQAVAAASLGMVPVSMICRVADDVFGKSLLTNFRKSNHHYYSVCVRK